MRVGRCLRAGLMLAALSLVGAAPTPGYDIVIRNGRLLDGAGNPWIAGDVAVRDGRIARIGKVTGGGGIEIDARGRYVAPGFIDMMDQSGEILRRVGAAENKLRMGVTTLIAGEGGTPVEATAIPAYFEELERKGIAVNFGTYYSAGQARAKVMGDRAGAPNAAQLAAMKVEVAAAMRAGVFGITTALIYPPDSFQSTEDLVALAGGVGACGGIYATHMRDEGAGLLSAIDEAIRIGEESGAKVEIFHLKAAYKPKAGKLMPQALDRIEAARRRGVDVAANVYPYPAAGTGIEVTIPTHIFSQGQANGWQRLNDPATRAQLMREVDKGSQAGWSNLVEASGGWGHVTLANAFDPKFDQWRGQSFAVIGKALGREPADVAWEIAAKALPNRAMALFFMMDENDVDLAVQRPWVSIGSDASATEAMGKVDALGLPHPRAYGTFPRVLADHVRTRGLLSLPEAIRKMTSWPAARMGLVDRGLLKPGFMADIVVFDAARVLDVADWANPFAGPEGIDDVIVNGKIQIRDGRATGARAGAVLRHACQP